MIEYFLRAKHWELFLLLFGLPFLFQISLTFIMDLNKEGDKNYFFSWTKGYLQIPPVLLCLIFAGLLAWIWAISCGLQRLIPMEINLNWNRFKLYLLIFLIGTIGYYGSCSTCFNLKNLGFGNFELEALLKPVLMFCFFNCLLFAAKVFKTAKLKQEVTFKAYAFEFFLMLFYPIGIWIIQPKIYEINRQKIIISNIG